MPEVGFELTIPVTYYELLCDVCNSTGEEEQQLCLDALMEQTSSSDMVDATHWECCEREDTAMLEFRRVPIVFGEDVEPTRLRGLLDLLAALTQLVDGEIWDENRHKIDDLPPYCTSCARFGHLAAACPHFFGRRREEPGFAPHRRHVEGTQNLELLGCTAKEVLRTTSFENNKF